MLIGSNEQSVSVPFPKNCRMVFQRMSCLKILRCDSILVVEGRDLYDVFGTSVLRLNGTELSLTEMEAFLLDGSKSSQFLQADLDTDGHFYKVKLLDVSVDVTNSELPLGKMSTKDARAFRQRMKEKRKKSALAKLRAGEDKARDHHQRWPVSQLRSLPLHC